MPKSITLCLALQHLCDSPDAISYASFHSRHHVQTLVNPNEIVPSGTEGQRRVKLLPLLRKGIDQAGESARLHSHGQVLSLGVRRADSIAVGTPEDRSGLAPDALSRRIARFALRIGSSRFHHLREARPSHHLG